MVKRALCRLLFLSDYVVYLCVQPSDYLAFDAYDIMSVTDTYSASTPKALNSPGLGLGALAGVKC